MVKRSAVVTLLASLLAGGCGGDSFKVQWGFYHVGSAPGFSPDGSHDGVVASQFSCADEGVSTVRLSVHGDNGLSSSYSYACTDMRDSAGGLAAGTYSQECVALDSSGATKFTADLSVFAEYGVTTLGQSSSQPVWCNFIVN
jgi:hypothetical protein